MKLYTSYFARVKKLNEMGFTNLVCVAGYAPHFYFEMGGRFYPDLAPRKTWWREWHDKGLGNDWYEQKYYETVLSKLNPEEVVHDLGDNAVMLCYEKSGDFCHRHIIANWINSTLGIEVEEVKFS